MSFYVKRIKLDDPGSVVPAGKAGYVGPFRTVKAAEREATAWAATGTYDAEVVPSTPELQVELRSWRKGARP